ncbi:MAG: hypothetical protein JWP69_1688 [Flaviaesturariibacter sp.]|nr:hypothetical protein [Flaviaesturariibacter sp.]
MTWYEGIIGHEWKEMIVLASVPLWKYEGILPVANASGCLVECYDSRFLLSIAHASVADSEWRMEVQSVDLNGGYPTTVLQPVRMNSLGKLHYLADENQFTDSELVDFTYLKIPPNLSSYHVIAIIGEQQVIGADRTIFKIDFSAEPVFDQVYGFYGNVKFLGVEGNRLLFSHRLEDNLRYIKSEGDYHVFQLPHKYGSHTNYQGCSGAPIIDKNNNVIALVAFGEKSTNTIYGINISKFKSALQIESQ